MSESYKALCNDAYANMKLQLRMEIPRTREAILDLFERARKRFPTMQGFRKTRREIALESPPHEMPHRWLGVRDAMVRCGCVNAENFEQATTIHRHLLETAPAYLSISPIDIDHVELMFGFDIAAAGNHDEIVMHALAGQSPLAALTDMPEATLCDYQPVVGLSIGTNKDVECYFEVKTRPADPARAEYEPGHEPISVYLVLRKFGPFRDVKELPTVHAGLLRIGEEIIERRVVPGLLVPIREAIGSSGR